MILFLQLTTRAPKLYATTTCCQEKRDVGSFLWFSATATIFVYYLARLRKCCTYKCCNFKFGDFHLRGIQNDVGPTGVNCLLLLGPPTSAVHSFVHATRLLCIYLHFLHGNDHMPSDISLQFLLPEAPPHFVYRDVEDAHNGRGYDPAHS